MVRTSVGEVGISTHDRDYILTPTLAHMAALGTPAEIIELYHRVNAQAVTPAAVEQQIQDALFVVLSCSDQIDFDFFGEVKIFGNQVMFSEGEIERQDLLVLARHLLMHGIAGASPLPPSKSGESANTFDVRAIVAAAIAYLGLPEESVWNMTMTSLALALRAKYPAKGQTTTGAPSEAELDAAMAWHDRILAKRQQREKLRYGH